MTEPDGIVLQMRRRIDTRLDRMEPRIDDPSQRMNPLERHCDQLRDDLVRIGTHLDQLERRIECRLNFVDA